MGEITALTVTYNTKDLFKRAYESFKYFYPDIPLVIVDGSDMFNPCFSYVGSLPDTVYQLKRNIGHGQGMDYGIKKISTEKILILDSDIEILKPVVILLDNLLTEGVYAVGEIYKIGKDGLHRNPVCDLPYVKPYFMLLSRTEYFKYHKFVHHGSPLYKAMKEVKEIRHFDLSGYVFHNWGGTRKINVLENRHEIPGEWET